MSDEAQQKPMRVISGKVVRGEGIRAVIQMLMKDHQQFDALMAIAVIPTDDPEYNDCRVYATNLTHLEKLGLLEQAKDTID